MTTAQQYAKALFLVSHPSVAKLRAALKSRGHEKLLPRIFSEYQKLLTAVERKKMYATTTPESERTRVLVQLYRTLVS